jgi:HEAT repeat protein
VDALPDLLFALPDRNMDVRLGVIEALGDIRDPVAVGYLVDLLRKEEHAEVRWAILLTLGEIGDSYITLAMAEYLQDPDMYVRYGAALGLENLGWTPPDEKSRIWYWIAKQQWEEIQGAGEEAIEPLLQILGDMNSRIRMSAIDVLGELQSPRAKEACDQALADPNGNVRWKALLAFPKCGIPVARLTLGLNKRPRAANPLIAAFLNFFFAGMGYNYLGKWWGFLLFQINLTMIVLLSLIMGPILPQLISHFFSSIFCLHAWLIAKELPDL